jgi:hypothetical protein
MARYKIVHVMLTVVICLVWFVNGLYCKVLNFVPRHQLIVSRIAGDDYAWFLTKAIGLSEMMMVAWIVSKIKSRACAIFQILIVGTMNMMEFMLVPDLLLFGRMNIVFASLFILMIYINEFVVRSEPRLATTE